MEFGFSGESEMVTDGEKGVDKAVFKQHLASI